MASKTLVQGAGCGKRANLGDQSPGTLDLQLSALPGRMEVTGGMPHSNLVSPRMPVVLQVQLTLACLTFLCRSVCHPQEGSVLADGLLLGSTGPGPSQFSFSRGAGSR